ncbi:MAG: Short-chain-enoyl-CoA hydratase [Alphaproteobacteria bacterium MarineAlpha4_Bin2]|nr:MAG: Short-chain-enoyl-CoA hydratase [Alphaproteobacteria bacterium MarineAlpha4_Bin2]|tara:strand:- start:44 stop:838 length:795 start_codon:yes stop_codon:yes gene_type:complete
MNMDAEIEDLVLVDFDDRGDAGRIARVTFNNPEKRNALGVGGKQRFINVMTELRHDTSLRALVITGAGNKSFVGGSNLADMRHYNPADGHAASTKTHYACDSVRTFPVPVIARINGYCFGSGMEIAAAADMRVAADHAKFGMPETRFGIPSGMEAALLPRLIGWGKAVELVLTGDHIDAEEAQRIGFLQKLVPYSELDLAIEGWIDSLLSCGQNAIRVQKRLINDWERMAITDAAKVGIEAIASCYATDEPRTLMNAFLNRKKG